MLTMMVAVVVDGLLFLGVTVGAVVVDIQLLQANQSRKAGHHSENNVHQACHLIILTRVRCWIFRCCYSWGRRIRPTTTISVKINCNLLWLQWFLYWRWKLFSAGNRIKSRLTTNFPLPPTNWQSQFFGCCWCGELNGNVKIASPIYGMLILFFCLNDCVGKYFLTI